MWVQCSCCSSCSHALIQWGYVYTCIDLIFPGGSYNDGLIFLESEYDVTVLCVCQIQFV